MTKLKMPGPIFWTISAGVIGVILGLWWIFSGTGIEMVGSAGLSFLLVAGGIIAMIWGKIPFARMVGGWMLITGAILAVLLWIFGDDNLQDWRESAREATTIKQKAVNKPLTKEEHEARLERQRQDAEVATQRAITEAIAREASRIATERAQVEMLRPATTRDCARYTEQSNCVEVLFGAHTVYDRVAKKGMCIVADPVRATERIDLGGDQYRYTAKPGVVVQFFDLPVGQAAAGTRCG